MLRKFLYKLASKRTRKTATEFNVRNEIEIFKSAKDGSKIKMFAAASTLEHLKWMKEDNYDLWKSLTDEYQQELMEMRYYLYSINPKYL